MEDGWRWKQARVVSFPIHCQLPFCICTRNLRFIVQKNSKWFWLLKSYHSLEIFHYWLPWFFHAKSSHLQPGTTAVFAAVRRAARYRSTKLIFSPTFSRLERCPAAWSPYHTWVLGKIFDQISIFPKDRHSNKKGKEPEGKNMEPKRISLQRRWVTNRTNLVWASGQVGNGTELYLSGLQNPFWETPRHWSDLAKCWKLRSNILEIQDVTLQQINISHLGKRKIIFKMPFLGDMLVSWRLCAWEVYENASHQLEFVLVGSDHQNRWCFTIRKSPPSPNPSRDGWDMMKP